MTRHLVGPSTDRLHHRALRVEDAEAFYVLNSHPEVLRWTGEPPLESPEAARAAIENYPDFATVGYGRWGCFLKGTQTLIGFCGLKYLPELEAVDVGYRFLPEYWGQGLATEACRASLAFGFDTLRLHEILGLVLAGNPASIRVLEKCGLQREGQVEFEGQTALRYVIRR